MPLRKALAAAQFDRPGWSKPVTRDEATSAVYGLSGHECGDIDRTLKHVLWPYWEDATPPFMSPRNSRLTWTPQNGPGAIRVAPSLIRGGLAAAPQQSDSSEEVRVG